MPLMASCEWLQLTEATKRPTNRPLRESQGFMVFICNSQLFFGVYSLIHSSIRPFGLRLCCKVKIYTHAECFPLTRTCMNMYGEMLKNGHVCLFVCSNAKNVMRTIHKCIRMANKSSEYFSLQAAGSIAWQPSHLGN